MNVAGLLYLLQKAPNGFPFRIRLQKMVLLGKLEFKFPFTFKYESHYYGPYSARLQSLLSDLITGGVVNEDVVELSNDRTGFVYSLTSAGKRILATSKLPTMQTKKLDDLWSQFHDKTTEYLVKMAKEKSGIKSRHEK